MDKRTRAYKIAKVGFDAYEDDTDASLISAIAAMIDYATKKPAKKEKPPLLYTEQDLLDGLKLEVARHGRLNGVLSNLTLQEGDVVKFHTWLRENMRPWLESKEIELTYSMLVRKFPEWLEKARQYDGKSSEPEVNAWR